MVVGNNKKWIITPRVSIVFISSRLKAYFEILFSDSDSLGSKLVFPIQKSFVGDLIRLVSKKIMPKNLKFFALKTIDTLVTPLEVTESDFTIGFSDLAENNSYPGSQGLAVILKKVGCKFCRFSEFF